VAAVLGAPLLCLHLGSRSSTESLAQNRNTRSMAGIQEAFRARHARASRTPPMRAGGSNNGSANPGWRRRARCCRRFWHCQRARVVPNRQDRSITFATGRSTCASMSDAASLDAIGPQLRSASWQADIMGGSASGDTYRGRLQIRKDGCLMRDWYAKLSEREQRLVLFGSIRRGAAVVAIVRRSAATLPDSPARRHQAG